MGILSTFKKEREDRFRVHVWICLQKAHLPRRHTHNTLSEWEGKGYNTFFLKLKIKKKINQS
jgi:hypothetical protein